MQGTDFTDIFYFIAVVGGTIALGAVLAFAMIRQRRRPPARTPGELQSGTTRREAEPDRPRTTTIEPRPKADPQTPPHPTNPQRH